MYRRIIKSFIGTASSDGSSRSSWKLVAQILGVASVSLFVSANFANAAISFTNTANITVENVQVESGGNTSANPDVTGGNGGALLNYTETGVFTCCTLPKFGGDNLDDGDIGAGVASDGSYAIPNQNTNLDLTFDAESTVVGIASDYALRTGYAISGI